MNFAGLLRALTVVAITAAPAAAQTLDKVTFGTNWVAEAEHGGFYQAVADGTYKKYGLDVTIIPGGPNVNNRILLPAGKLDFFMSANSLQAFDAAEQNIPTVSVAAIFQKDPQVLLAHPDVASFDDLKTRTLFVSKEGMASYFQWLKADFGFKDSQVKPYTFNPQPFLVDKRSAMQGYVTSEPYAVEKQGGFKPKIFLLADKGFDSYSTLIETRRDLIEKKPDLVQRFVDASIIGWYNYLYGDNKAANALIRKHNPGDERGTARLFGRQDEGIRHRRFRRHAETRHRRADRCAYEKLLRQDGARGRDQAECGLSPRLFHPIRQQGRRAGSASEAVRALSAAAARALKSLTPDLRSQIAFPATQVSITSICSGWKATMSARNPARQLAEPAAEPEEFRRVA